MIIFQNIIEALRAIRANFQRTVLTILIIAIGLTALIGVLTAIDGIRFWFSDSFLRLGAQNFRIENYTTTLRSGGPRAKRKTHRPITYREALEFKEDFSEFGPVSIVGTGSFLAQAKYKSKSTQNNLQLMGGDPEYVFTNNYTIAQGRNLTADDLRQVRSVIVVGDEVVRLLFPQVNPIGELLYMDGKAYRIVGTFESVGAQGMVGGDKVCIIPATTLEKDFPRQRRSFGVHVAPRDLDALENTVYEAVGLMRQIRSLKPQEKNDFGVIRVDQILGNFMENMRFLTWSATVISIITLISAAIGLMNIMLVSVTERTKEIGIRKATGATRRHILAQFLTEALVITQIGGLLGIGLGIAAGNIAGALMGTRFIVPWNWILLGMGLCVLVGVVAGIYPARKAARQDPIEALRYE